MSFGRGRFCTGLDKDNQNWNEEFGFLKFLKLAKSALDEGFLNWVEYGKIMFTLSLQLNFTYDIYFHVYKLLSC
jgi:hypothetical protein